jgi:predicted PurR-regulated permease PerM
MIDRILFSRTLQNKFLRLHKFLSLLLAYCIVIGFIVLVLTFVIPQIIDSILQLIRQSSSMYDTIADGMALLSERYPDTDFAYLQSVIDEALPNAISYVQTLMADAVPVIYNAGMSIISWILNIIMAFVISCYLMTGKQRMLHGLKRIVYALFSEETAYKIIITIKECNHIFSQYIIGKALDSLIIGIICFVLMCILNLQYALLISIVVGITNMIPYFGPFIGAIPGFLILLIISPKSAFIFLILIFALQQFDGSILGPKIIGNSTGLQPIWIIFAIIAGGAIGGVVGMFLGVPVVAVLVYLLNQLFDYLLYRKKIQADLSNVTIPDVNPDNVFIPKEFVDNTESEDQNADQ